MISTLRDICGKNELNSSLCVDDFKFLLCLLQVCGIADSFADFSLHAGYDRTANIF